MKTALIFALSVAALALAEEKAHATTSAPSTATGTQRTVVRGKRQCGCGTPMQSPGCGCTSYDGGYSNQQVIQIPIPSMPAFPPIGGGAYPSQCAQCQQACQQQPIQMMPAYQSDSSACASLCAPACGSGSASYDNGYGGGSQQPQIIILQAPSSNCGSGVNCSPMPPPPPQPMPAYLSANQQTACAPQCQAQCSDTCLSNGGMGGMGAAACQQACPAACNAACQQPMASGGQQIQVQIVPAAPANNGNAYSNSNSCMSSCQPACQQQCNSGPSTQSLAALSSVFQQAAAACQQQCQSTCQSTCAQTAQFVQPCQQNGSGSGSGCACNSGYSQCGGSCCRRR